MNPMMTEKRKKSGGRTRNYAVGVPLESYRALQRISGRTGQPITVVVARLVEYVRALSEQDQQRILLPVSE